MDAEKARLVAPGAAGGFERLDSARVRFRLVNESAQSVTLTGDWNNWAPTSLQQDPSGTWSTVLKIPSGRHLYRFIVDGLPTIDPANGAIDLAPDGGLASVVDSMSALPRETAIQTEKPVPTGADTPTLGPLRLGVRYRGLLTQEFREGEVQATEGEHSLDLPVAARLPGKGWLDLLFGAHSQANTDHANVELLRLRAEMRSGRARVRLFRNYPALPGGAAPVDILSPRSRFGYPAGLQARGASARLRVGDFRATLMQMDEQQGSLGSAARLGAAAISTPVGPGHLVWSGARETGRAQRFVRGDTLWSSFPSDVDSLREDESRSLGWRLGAQWDPPRQQSSGGFAHAAWTEGRNDWVPVDEWVNGKEHSISSSNPIRDARTRTIEASGGWMNRLPAQGVAASRIVLRSWRLSWVREAIDPADGDTTSALPSSGIRTDRLEGRLYLDLLRWQLMLHAAFRHSEGTTRGTDPLLADWAWRGLVSGVGRAAWWELPLLGTPNLTEIGATLTFPYRKGNSRPPIMPSATTPNQPPLQRSADEEWAARLVARSHWDRFPVPALTMLQASAEVALDHTTYVAGDLLVLHHHQGRLNLNQWVVAPFIAYGQRPAPALSVQVGLGINPLNDDPITRERIERGRDDLFLEGSSNYAELAFQNDVDFVRDFKRREDRFTDRLRLELEVIYHFGEPRIAILNGGRR